MKSVYFLFSVLIITCLLIQSFLGAQSLINTNTEDNDIHSSRSNSFVYHNYTEMESELQFLEIKYPKLFELDTAQDLFSLPNCRDGYKIWVGRITNEDITSSKPEVLYVGGHHGNEDISIEVPFYFINWLLENYAIDDNVKHIVDTRELYIVPVLNPYGWENDERFDGFGEDVNRDYPFGNESFNEALTTIGARAMHELMKAHIFTAGISWHSGDEVIYYAWGTPLHNTINDESPDDKAYRGIGERLAEFGGNYDNKYVHGPANQVIYSADGAWSDYAYAASWDPAGMDPAYPSGGARMLAFGVEISDVKKPPESQFGTVIDIYGSPEDVDGYIPKNIRLAYALAELAEPYIKVQNRTGLPSEVEPGANVTLSWKVHGAVSVDQTNIRHGHSADPETNYNYSTANQSGTGGLAGTKFSQAIQVPDEEGTYQIIIRARVDQNYAEQFVPEPLVAPQSVYVNARTNESYSYSNGGRTATGKLDYYSEVITVEIVSEPVNASIEILEFNYSDMERNDNATLRWRVNGTDEIKEQIVHQTRYQVDVLDSVEKITEGIKEITTNNGTEYVLEFLLPSYWGYYYYMIETKLDEDHSIFSDEKIVWIFPELEYLNYPKEVFVNDTITIEWELKGSLEIMNMTSRLYPENPPDDVIDDRYNVGTIFGAEGKYNLTFKVPMIGGKYYFYITSKFHDDDEDHSHTISFAIGGPLEIIVEDMIVVTTPYAVYDPYNKSLIVSGIHAECTNLSHGKITPDNTITHELLIINEDIEIIFFTDLLWSSNGWYVTINEIDDWDEGEYYVIASFWDGMHLGESIHVENDTSEFTITNQTGEPDNGDIGKDGISMSLLLVISIVILINVFGIIFYFQLNRKKPESPDVKKEEIDESVKEQDATKKKK